jgi:E-phenylitaconyl-CoA hydratase
MTIKRITEGAVAIILIDRPEKLNALDAEHLTELRGQLANAAADPAVRVIILSGGDGRAFCVGADLTAGRADEVGPAEAIGLSLEESGQKGLYIRLFNLQSLQIRKPLIASVNGLCLGGGLELALQCDFIIASETASFGLPEVAVSSLPGGGGVPNLLKAIPRGVAMRMLLTGDRIDAHRALALGLVTEICPPAELSFRTAQVAGKIAENGPLAVQLVKMLAINSDDASSAQAFQMTELAWGLLRDTADRREGRMAFAEKRKPLFVGR